MWRSPARRSQVRECETLGNLKVGFVMLGCSFMHKMARRRARFVNQGPHPALLLLRLALLSSVATCTIPKVSVDSSSGFFVDPAGRALTFHGVNAVEKLAPFLPPTGPASSSGGSNGTSFDPVHSLSAGDARKLRGWGMNVVRLGVLWEAVVPVPGQVNETYLGHVSQLIDTLSAEGIYTIVDMHQDAMGARFCGEGFPDWAVRKVVSLANASGDVRRFPAPHTAWDMEIDAATGYPSRAACAKHPDFFEYVKTDESAAAWKTFFATPALWDDFAFHWQAVARALAGKPGVLGFELLNEPFNPDAFKSDTDELLPLYQRLHRAIRQWDNTTVLFYEPHVMGIQYGMSTDFPEGGPGGAAYNDRQAFAFHIYCWNTSRPIMEPVCDLAFDLGWSAAARSLRRVRGGGFLTEFGAVSDDKVSLALLEASLARAEGHLSSWAYWSYKSFDDITTEGSPFGESFYHPDGSVQAGKVQLMTRPYAPAVAGRPTEARFDKRTGTFTLKYTVVDDLLSGGSISGGGSTGSSTGTSSTNRGGDSDGSGADDDDDDDDDDDALSTVVFAHRALHYPNGVSVTVVPAGAATVVRPPAGADDENLIYVKHVPGAVKTGDTMTVLVRRAAQ